MNEEVLQTSRCTQNWSLWSAFTLLRNMNFAPKRLCPLARALVLQTSRCTQNWSFVVCVHIAAQYELRPKAAVPAGAGAGFTNQPLHAAQPLCRCAPR